MCVADVQDEGETLDGGARMVLFAARRSSSVSSRRMKTKQFLKLKVSEVREKKLAPPDGIEIWSGRWTEGCEGIKQN